jgi:hypothetical protein
MANKDKLKGGFSDKMSAESIAKKHKISIKDINAQIKKGVKVEMEHVDTEDLAREIALDHLFEIPDYYTRLEKMEKEAKKDMKEGKENITEFARRMRELAGLSDGNQSKSLKTVQNGESSFEGGATFYAKDMTTPSENKEGLNENFGGGEDYELEDRKMQYGVNPEMDDEFETVDFEQEEIEEGENDSELYNLNENTTIILDFLDEDE